MSSEWLSVAEIFGEDVFNDAVMQERLPKKVYKKLKQTIEEGKMTKDLALITELKDVTVLNSENFIKAIRDTLDRM